MTIGNVSTAYLSAAVFFFLFIRGLFHKKTMWRTLGFAVLGTVLTASATFFRRHFPGNLSNGVIVSSLLAGVAALTVYSRNRVQVAEVHVAVAGLQLVVCLAALLIGFYAHLTALPVVGTADVPPDATKAVLGFLSTEAARAVAIKKIGISLGILLGVATLAGWTVAFGRLSTTALGQSLTVAGELSFGGALIALIFLSIYLGEGATWALIVLVAAAAFVGSQLVMRMCAADMPIVLATLHSCSGWAAAATGLTLGDDFLAIAGTMVGASGTMLTYFTCKDTSRSFVLLILGEQSSSSIGR